MDIPGRARRWTRRASTAQRKMASSSCSRYSCAMKKPSMPVGPLAGPSVWRGADFAPRPGDWIRTFSATELAELARAIRTFQASGAGLAAIAPANFPLPTLGDVLRDAQRELLEGRGFAMLRGLPVERYSREEQAI